jgi:histidyl-tRNA synthetase
LDCKKEGCRALSEEAPKTLDSLCGDCSEHWTGLVKDLDHYALPHCVDHRLVRGLDYYNRTTFELICTGGLLGSQNTIAGGGRYDGLVEQLGGPSTPAVGFAMGVDRVLLALPPEKPELPSVCDVFIVARGEEARLAGLTIAQSLRKHGLAVQSDPRGTSVKSQMKRADRLDARIAIILGDREIEENIATLRRLTDSEQQDVPRDSLEERVLAALKG